MKLSLMLNSFKTYAFLPLLFLMIITSCQEEETLVINPEPNELIEANSTLTGLMSLTSARDGAFDDILDSASCLALNLPVTVTVNNITVTINTLEDLELIEAIINEFDTDDDILELLYPISITLNDYTTVVINNEDELNEFVDDCVNQEDVIECIDFQYPISFAIYDSNFQVIETVVIENDQELYLFLQGIENGTNNGVLVSLNFPVTMIYANGNTIEVNNNEELEAAINEAEDDCAQVDCSEEEVEMYLLECNWSIASYNNQNSFENYILNFDLNEVLNIYNGSSTQYITALWSTYEDNNGNIILVISDVNDTDLDLQLSHDWLVIECSEDRFELVSGDNIMVIERLCENNNQTLLDCYSLYVESQECDDNDDGEATFVFETEITTTQECQELYPLGLTVHPTYDDAANGTNPMFVPLTTPLEFASQTFYIRVYSEVTLEYAIQELELVVESCNTNFDCPDIEANIGDECETGSGALGTVSQDCECIENNAFDCPDLQANFGDECETGSGALGTVNQDCECLEETNPFECYVINNQQELFLCLDFYYDIVTYDLTLAYANCVDSNLHILTYFESFADAQTNSNPILTPENYNVEAPYELPSIFVRVELLDGSAFEIFEIFLYLEGCNQGPGCSEQQLTGYLLECNWIGNNNATGYTFTFNQNNELIIEGNGQIQTGVWEVYSQFLTNSGSSFTFLNLSNFSGDFQIFDGEYQIIECGPERIVVIGDGIPFTVIERDCNTNNPFTCFDELLAVTVCDEDDGVVDGSHTFNLEEFYIDCTQNNDFVITYHYTTQDAENQVNELSSPYTSFGSSEILFSRIEHIDSGAYVIYEVDLFIEVCEPSNCSEEQLNFYLEECSWNIVDYNGSNDLIIYNFDFNSDGTVTIEGDGQIITANWSTEINAGVVWINFSNVNGGVIQTITGNWQVVLCNPDRIELIMNNDFMYMEQTC